MHKFTYSKGFFLDQLGNSYPKKCDALKIVDPSIENFFAPYKGYEIRKYSQNSKTRNIRDSFQNNIQAPFQLMVIILDTILTNTIAFFIHFIHAAINLVTFEFSTAKDFFVEMLFDVSDLLLTTLRTSFDILVSTLQLITRPCVSVADVLSSGSKGLAIEEINVNRDACDTRFNSSY